MQLFSLTGELYICDFSNNLWHDAWYTQQADLVLRSYFN